MKEMMKNTGIMLVITLVAGLILGFVYQITKDPIAEQTAPERVSHKEEVERNAYRQCRKQRVRSSGYTFENSHQPSLHP